MEPRLQLLNLLTRDLIGPQGGGDEIIANRPSDQYLTGILYPAPSERDAEQQQSDDDGRDAGDDSEGTPGDSISMQSMRRPNSMGISFAVTGDRPTLSISGTAGRYERRWQAESGLTDLERERAAERWARREILLDREIRVEPGVRTHEAPEGLQWYVRAFQSRAEWQVTVVLVNAIVAEPGRVAAEEGSFFQVHFTVRVEQGVLTPRRPRQSGNDEDASINNLTYRNAREWAVGHTCGATWDDDERATQITATWMPIQLVRSVDPVGDSTFADASDKICGSVTGAFDAELLASEGSVDRLFAVLNVVPAAYRSWLDGVEETVASLEKDGELSASNVAQARRHLTDARKCAERMAAGARTIRDRADARMAFQLAQRAMLQQRRWEKRNPYAPLIWRPFQLGFQLLVLSSLSSPRNDDGSPTDDRLTMDLLWFPTGGGKTEAYLALTAFVLFLRRLSARNPDDGAGVAVIMRYTLRLLTAQQFERASRLILSCEFERRTGRATLGQIPFSIGLWVGSGATPNRIADARSNVDEGLKAQQLARCPACGEKSLKWDAQPRSPRYVVACTNEACPFGKSELPIATIDQEVYSRRPSLLIGTVDKFAQIVRNEETSAFFPPARQPPDLIIQDELHLISGPLGTMAGVYEAAVDLLCTANDIPPKVIGSTATIRRARKQVRSLFNREVAQFPPPVLDAANSCFAIRDDRSPGRLYVGLTSAGRSPKFLLQAACASLLQSASELDIPAADRDPFWTLVAYFNSLRELGGALVMMQDDVRDSIRLYATLHGSKPRTVPDEVQELTSRVASQEIPSVLDRLTVQYPDQETAVVLATNMLSVGIDIPRLGLMVVNGQPKSMSEYIQATSRVGRNVIPGLVVTCYNAGRPRDRSHFEAFRTWHATLYREVEATSVTPFAPRARDRALHAALVALARHRVAGMLTNPVLTEQKRGVLELLVDSLVSRIRQVDPDEADDAAAELRRFMEIWQRRDDLREYWNDWQHETALLLSAERAATIRALLGMFSGSAKPTPNSLRDVEPSVTVRVRSRLD